MLLVNPVVAAAIALVVGLSVGSFLNVVVHRLPRMMERDWRAQCAELRGENVPDENGRALAPTWRRPALGCARDADTG